jgi:AraC-like DNA-binding protein
MDDTLSSMLRDVRPRGALFDRSLLSPPWSLRFEEGAPLTLLTMISGTAWVIFDDQPPTRLGTGDVAIVKGPGPYTVADDPDTAPVVVKESPMCQPSGDALEAAILLKGTFQVRGGVSRRVLSALPRVARVPSPPGGCPTVTMITNEIHRDALGRQIVLDRMLDLLLVTSMREWFELSDAHAPAWYRAHSDPEIGQALRLIHDNPAHPWTVAELATKVGTSRARFAQRFAELVGQPPMAYLTQWRVYQAADLLTETDATVESIAHQVGYSTAYALSVAFKRTLGTRPTTHRTTFRTARAS